jgi:hypothetical protein
MYMYKVSLKNDIIVTKIKVLVLEHLPLQLTSLNHIKVLQFILLEQLLIVQVTVKNIMIKQIKEDGVHSKQIILIS